MIRKEKKKRKLVYIDRILVRRVARFLHVSELSVSGCAGHTIYSPLQFILEESLRWPQFVFDEYITKKYALLCWHPVKLCA